MQNDVERDLIDSALEQLEDNFQDFACDYDDFLNLCSPEQTEIRKSNDRMHTMRDLINYAVTLKEDSDSDASLDEEKIFEVQLQGTEVIKKIERDIEELTTDLKILDESCEALENCSEPFPLNKAGTKRLKQDFLKHKNMLREVALKVFGPGSEEFLNLLNELFKIHFSHEEFLDLELSNLNISQGLIRKLVSLDLLEQHPTDFHKFRLVNLL